MGGLFGGGGSPSPPPAPAPAPAMDNSKVQEAMAREAALARKRRGRRGTVLTGEEEGLVTQDSGAPKVLLGQ